MAGQRRIRTPKEIFDEPWKQIVPALFEQFVAFFAPTVWQDIDWNRPPVFLDKELRRVAKGLGKRRVTADFLVQVWGKDGANIWFLAHIELLAQKDELFPERMFRYNFRAFDLHGRPVCSLAILADDDTNWRPDLYEYELWGSRTGIKFNTIKLLDFTERLKELEASDNPFAFAVLAHLKTLETRGDAESRLDWKLRFLRTIYGRRRDRREVEELFLFLDWIMGVPEQYEDRFETGIQELEGSRLMTQAMPPIVKRAHERAYREALITVMEERFGSVDADLRARIELIKDVGRLNRLLSQAATVSSPCDLTILE